MSTLSTLSLRRSGLGVGVLLGALMLPQVALATVGDIPPAPLLIEPGGELFVFDLDAATRSAADPEVFFNTICVTDVSTSDMDARLDGVGSLARGRCQVTQSSAFDIDPGATPGSVLMTHIMGNVKLNGYLALIGLGQAQANVVLEVLDLGPSDAPGTPRVVACQTLDTHKVVNELKMSLSGGLSLKGGSATIVIAGVSVGMSGGIPICIEVVRNTFNFDLDVPLRRGHRYEIQISLRNSMKLGPAGGFAVVSFNKIFGLPENLTSPATWFDNSDLMNPALPNIDFSSIVGGPLFDFPSLTVPNSVPLIGGATLFGGSGINFPAPYANTNAILTALGIPTNLRQVLETPLLGLVGDHVDELILDSGFCVNDLALYMESDSTEGFLKARIRTNLVRPKERPVAQFQLPQEFGGNLETVREIVAEAIDNLLAAGQKIHKADLILAKADELVADGKYKQAYQRYRLAYRKATDRP